MQSRELATVLVALRYWQEQLVAHGTAIADRFPQFEEHNPLTLREIDDLCEGLNVPPEDNDLCDCEKPGFYSCGVPGVLAHLKNGRVAPAPSSSGASSVSGFRPMRLPCKSSSNWASRKGRIVLAPCPTSSLDPWRLYARPQRW